MQEFLKQNLTIKNLTIKNLRLQVEFFLNFLFNEG